MSKTRKPALLPQCGEFVNGAQRVVGVMLMADASDPCGQWWVGGMQRALVRWADGAADKQTKLYNHVRRTVIEVEDYLVYEGYFDCRTPTIERRALEVLRADPKVAVVWSA